MCACAHESSGHIVSGSGDVSLDLSGVLEKNDEAKIDDYGLVGHC